MVAGKGSRYRVFNPETDACHLLCGSPDMVDDTKEALKARGLTMNRRGEGMLASHLLG